MDSSSATLSMSNIAASISDSIDLLAASMVLSSRLNYAVQNQAERDVFFSFAISRSMANLR